VLQKHGDFRGKGHVVEPTARRAESTQRVGEGHSGASLVKGSHDGVEVSNLGNPPFTELTLVAEALSVEARHVVGEERNAAVDVGLYEIAVLLQA
jgi:hypothetical protein